MKVTIGDAIGINGGSDEIDLLTRRVETLNKRMMTLVNETIQSGGDMESNEDEFKDISEQIEQLNRRIAAIQDSLANDMSRQERLEQIQKVIEQREQNSDQYDDSIVRQMIECIKVHSDGKLTIIFGDTYAATEMTLRRFTSRGDATFHFFYDYGDGWEVVLRLEEVFEDSELPGKELPRVLEGQGFGIIEDCGGPAGLEHLREVFQQKSSPEYQSMREWLGTSEVDLSVFDLQDLNFRLKKLPRIFRDLYEYDYPPTKHSIDLLDRKYCKTN